MASANAGPISGRELIRVIQGGQTVWLNRTEFASLIALPTLASPRPYNVPTTFLGTEVYEAYQDGSRITMSAADMAAFLAASGPVGVSPGPNYATAATGAERIVGRQDAWRVALNTSESGAIMQARSAAPYIETIKRVGGSTTNNYVSNSPASGGAIVNRTYGVTVAAERKATEVRVIIFNPDITSGYDIHGLSVYPTNTAASGDPTGNEVPITFNGVSPSTGTPVSGAPGIAGPSGDADDRLHTWIRSDWSPITMVDRVDGGPGSLLQVRIFSSGGLPRVNTNSGFTTTYDTNWNAPAGGRTFKTWYATGDLTHTRAWGVSTLQATHPLVIVQTRGAAPILNAGMGFDSQPQGFASGPNAGNSSGATGFVCQGVQSQALRASGPLFGMANLGSAGQKGSSGHLNMRTWIDALELRALFMQVWSGNSGFENIERDKALALETIAYAQARGCTPILMGAYPRIDSTIGGAKDEALLLGINSWNAASGLDYINVYDALGDGASPQRLQSQYSSDNTHRNWAGQAVEAAPVLAKAQEVAARYGIS